MRYNQFNPFTIHSSQCTKGNGVTALKIVKNMGVWLEVGVKYE